MSLLSVKFCGVSHMIKFQQVYDSLGKSEVCSEI